MFVFNFNFVFHETTHKLYISDHKHLVIIMENVNVTLPSPASSACPSSSSVNSNSRLFADKELSAAESVCSLKSYNVITRVDWHENISQH